MKHQLSPAEIIACFSGIDETHNIWRAIMSMAEYEISDLIKPASDPGLPDSERHYRAGALSHAIQFRDTLTSTMEQAKKLR